MKKRMCFVLLFMLIVNVFYVSAITGSIGNARMILYPEVNGWFTTTIEKTILVKNVNTIPINITLKLDEEGGKFLELIDKEFTLQPNEEKRAKFLVKIKKEGRYEGKINVFFSPLEKNEAGVILSSNIIVIAKENQDDKENIDADIDENLNLTNNEDNIKNINGDEVNRGAILLTVSTLVLLVILIVLLGIIKNKRKNRRKNSR